MLTSQCKICLRNKQLNYKKQNRETLNKKTREWYERNRSRENKKAREYYKLNKDSIKKYFSNYQKSEKGREILRHHASKRTANKKHLITDSEWNNCKKYFNYKCAYCGFIEQEHREKYNQQLHKEHVVHDGVNNLRNCVPACKVCNSEKSTHTLNYWYNKNNIHYNQDRYFKIYTWLRYDHKKYIEKKT